MGFKTFYLYEMAGNPATTFAPDMVIRNPFTEQLVNVRTSDYDAAVEYSPLLKSLFGEGGIKEKGQMGVPQGSVYPIWDRASNHLFVVYGGPDETSESEYDRRKDDFHRRGIVKPSSPSEKNDLVKRGIPMSIFDKGKVEKKHFSKRASTPVEKAVVSALKKAIKDMRDDQGTPYAIKNAEGIDDAIS
jgi:hypothetical protein